MELIRKTPISVEDYLIEVYKNHNILGLGEGVHGLVNSHNLFQKIFENKQLQETINIVILEFANVSFQAVLDKYMNGENVDISVLRKVWRESTQSPERFGEAPVYLELLQKIKSVNHTLTPDKKIRVLAGDPAINWKAIKTLEDYLEIIKFRNTFPAELAIEFGIKQKKKVLLIYSGYHFTKVIDNELNASSQSITFIVNSLYPDAMKVIEVLNPEAFQLEDQTKNWPLNSIIDILNDDLGNLPADKLFPSIFDKNDRPLSLFKKYKTKEVFDALLYLGTSKSWKISEIPNSTLSDKKYLNELNRRRKILGKKLYGLIS